MKKTVLSSMLLLSCAAQAAELTTFNDVATAISQGQHISFALDTTQCSSSIPMPAVSAMVTPNAVVVVNNAKITASLSHFTLDSPTSPGKPVFDYMKYNIATDGTASMKMTIMNAVSYEKINSFQIDCKLGQGFKVFAQ